MPSHKATSPVTLAHLEAGQVGPATGGRTLAFAGRTELLRLWDIMGADQQDQLLLAAKKTLLGAPGQARVGMARKSNHG